MGEDVGTNSRLFELPSEGKVHLPEFQPLPREELPREIMNVILKQDSNNTITRREMLGPSYRLDFGETGLVYVVPLYEERESLVNKQNAVYAVDVSKDGQLMGVGISTLTLPSGSKNERNPFVRDTLTRYDFGGRGLGLRRLIVLNEANILFFQLPLESNPAIKPQAENLWRELEVAGLVEKVGSGYRFVK